MSYSMFVHKFQSLLNGCQFIYIMSMKHVYFKKLTDAFNNFTYMSKRVRERLEHQEVRHDNYNKVLRARNREFVENGNSVVSFIGEERWRGQVLQYWDVLIDIYYL